MASQRWLNIWDATFAVTGSVYLTPTFASGTETGLPIYTAPATKYFTAGQGAPARNVNWAIQQQGTNRMQADQHLGMKFESVHDSSTTITCMGFARSWRGFLVGDSTTLSLVRDPCRGAQEVLGAMGANKPLVVFDDGTNIWAFRSSAGLYNFWNSSATGSGTVAGFYPFAARAVSATSFVMGASGTNTVLLSISGTAVTTVSPPAATFSTTTTTEWGSCQVYLGAYTATGPALMYPRGVNSSSFRYLFVSNTATTAAGTFPANRNVIDIAYDDVQSQFILATSSTTSGTASNVSFYTSSDGLTWTASTTATGPTSFTTTIGITSTIAFDICCGIWMLVASPFTIPTLGAYAGVSPSIFAFYSLDFGVTWQPVPIALKQPSVGGVVYRILHSVNQFAVYQEDSNGDFAMSGILGYPESL